MTWRIYFFDGRHYDVPMAMTILEAIKMACGKMSTDAWEVVKAECVR